MKRFYLFFCLISILGSTVQAQIPQGPQSLPSPNVASLGLYGEIPVSGFTGIPEISIPLYDISIGEFNMPISLSYHAAGVRPDQHPGWVGEGWNLNVGGAISRVVNGKPDDLHIKNYPQYHQIGYYFHPGVLNTPVWNTPAYLKETAQNMGNADFEPDEFNFNFMDYHGKFMLNSDKTWIVQCDKPVKVEFNETWLNVPFDKSNTKFENSGYSASFDGFTLTTEDGIRYIFGKEKNAIEYSIPFFDQATEPWTATAWHLTKIILTNEQEITYSYDRGEFINQMHIALNDDLGSFTFDNGILDPDCSSSSHSSIEASYQGSLISPVYLNHIVLPEGKVMFDRSESTELRYPRNIYDFKYSTWQQNRQYRFVRFLADNGLNDNYPNCLDKMKWSKLTRISINNKIGKMMKSYIFDYSKSTSERLTLKNLYEFTWGMNGKAYRMEYNHPELLPSYLSGKTDHWGFYNNTVMTDNYATHYDSREPNPAVSTYGLLEKLHYPTGGYTRFVFESHAYHRQVKMNRWEGYEDMFANKPAGGVRIKQLINSVSGKAENEIIDKEYFYVNDYLANKENANVSSGVLGGQFKYYFDDYQVQGDNVKKIIKRFSSQSVLPACVNSSGCHIGYSEVVEKRQDGSFIRRQYTNIDNGHCDEAPEAIIFQNRNPYSPYSSRAMERGKLLSDTIYSAEGKVKASKRISYERSSDHYVKSMQTTLAYLCPGSFMTYADGCTYKVHLYNYRQKSIEDTNYDNPSAPVTLHTSYEYDPYGLIKEISTSTNGGIRKMVYKRACDFTSDIYTAMVNNHVLSPIVEEAEYFTPEGKSPQLIWQNKHIYDDTSSDHLFICLSTWQKIGKSPLKEVYTCLDYDQLGHPIYVERNGRKTIYLWSYNCQHLAAEINGISIDELQNAIGSIIPFMESETPDFSKLLQLRIYLPKALVTTYTHQPLVGVTSTTDPRGVSTYYEYDLLQRLKKQKDYRKSVEKIYDYQYARDFQL